jgi:DNA-binding GntR family transcriptional regulator
LAAEGALELGAGRSVIVPEMTRRRFDEVMEIRLRLETLAVEAAAVRITDAEIAAAHAIQDRQLAHYRARDYKAVLQCNEDFHFQIYRASGLPILVQIVEALWLKVGPTLNLLHTNYSAGWRGDENHRAILAALEQHDAAAAAAAVRRDLIDGKARLDGLLPD